MTENAVSCHLHAAYFNRLNSFKIKKSQPFTNEGTVTEGLTHARTGTDSKGRLVGRTLEGVNKGQHPLPAQPDRETEKIVRFKVGCGHPRCQWAEHK